MSLRFLIAASLSFLACQPGIAQADSAAPPAFALYITQPLGLDPVEKCQGLAIARRQTDGTPPGTTLALSAQDVESFDAASGTLTLDRTRFADRQSAWALVDRCFVLELAGRPPVGGVALWTYTARLITMPLLSVSSEGGQVKVQLLRGNGAIAHQLYRPQEIEKALRGKTVPAQDEAGR